MAQRNTASPLQATSVVLLVALWLCDAAEASQLRALHQAPDFRQAPEGSSIDLNCEVNDPRASVRLWKMINWVHMFTPTQNVVKNGQRYTLHKLKQSSKGHYHCRATSSSKGKLFIPLGQLFITPAPKDPPLPSAPSSHTAIVGENVTITCTASGDQISAVQWVKDGVRVTKGEEHVGQHKTGGRVVITNVLHLSKLDGGYNSLYECRAFASNNTARFWAAQTFLKVQDSLLCPVADGLFADPESNKSYVECAGGISTRKNCSQGLEWEDSKKKCLQPALQWISRQQDQRPIPKKSGESHTFDCRLNNRSVRVVLESKVSSRNAWQRRVDGCKVTRVGQMFTVHALQVGVDSASYSCMVPGVPALLPKPLGSLTVQPKSYIASVRNLIAPVGSSVDLDCAGQEIPNPLLQLQLIAADGHAKTIKPDGKNVIRDGHVFTIKKLGRDMRGTVQCRVQSACSRKAKSVDLGYLLPLPVSGPPINVNIQPSAVAAKEGKWVTFTCTASIDKIKGFTWYKDEELTTTGVTRVSDNSSRLDLTISPSSVGIYRCRVDGPGVGYWIAEASMKGLPGVGEEVTGPPKRVYEPLFGEMKISCKAGQAQGAVKLLQKVRGGKVITRRPDGVKVLHVGHIFTVGQLDKSDEGEYSCSTGGGRVVLSVNISDSDIIVSPPRQTEYFGDVDLMCYFNSTDNSTWIFKSTGGQSSVVPSSEVIRAGDSISKLQIRNATLAEYGTYTCYAHAGDRVLSESTALTVKDPKQSMVFEASSSLNVKENETAHVWCKVDVGSPLPSLSWLLNGKLIQKCRALWKQVIDCPTPSDKYHAYLDGGMFKLDVLGSSFPADAGTYSCVVDNQFGATDNATVTVNVLAKPHLRNHTSNVKLVGVNETVSLRCDVERSNPPVSGISWWYQPCSGDACQPLPGAWSRLPNGSPQLMAGARDGHAMYRCIAENRIGNDSREFSVLRFEMSAPRITKFLPQVVMNSSQDVELVCAVAGSPLPDVVWSRNGQRLGSCANKLPSLQKTCQSRLPPRYTFSWTGSGSRLRIENAFAQFDAGEFTCTVVSPLGRKEANATLTLREKPVVHPGNKRELTLGFHEPNTLTLTVSEGSPDPHFKWFFQQISTQCNSRRAKCPPDPRLWRLVPSGWHVWPSIGTRTRKSTLSIPPLWYNLHFKGTAENDVGTADVSFSVYRQYSPKESLPRIRTSPPGAEVDEEDELILTCEADAFSVDALSWERDGEPGALANSPNRQLTLSVDFHIPIVRPSHGGLYRCLAYTSNDTKIAQVNVTVRALSEPRVVLANETVNERESNATVLRCQVLAGHPRPQVTWFRNGRELKVYTLAAGEGCGKNGFYHQQGNKTLDDEHLVICDPSHVENTGLYECRASNKRGQQSARAYLDVTAPPTIVKPREKMLHYEIGDNLTVSCEASGNPKPSVKWLKKSKELHNPVEDPGEDPGILTIDEMREEHFDEYFCVAENKLGHDSVKLSIVQSGAVAQAGVGVAPGNSSVVVAIAASAVLATLLIVFVLIALRRRHLYGGVYLCSSPPAPDFIDKLDPSLSLYEQVHKLPYNEKWEFPREQLHIKHILGSGAFGAVYYAEADSAIITDSSSSSASIRRRLASYERRRGRRRSSAASLKEPSKVAVKTLKEGAGETEYKDLVSELKILIHVGSHVNIVNLLGACTKGREYDICVIMEYCPHGNLLKFLRARRESYRAEWLPHEDQEKGSLCLETLVSYAYQISRAMEFLASRKCVHRDLAARNVLVGENYVMKVADFGMARDLYKNDQYVKQSAGLVPVKWMALESLADNFYSQKSDMWSFGVLLWEMFTLGGNPYPNLPATEIYQFLSEGRRMDSPEDCPEFINAIMRDCWLPDPDDRPVFTELVKRLDQIIESQMDTDTYLELNANIAEPENEVDGYLQPADGVSFASTPSNNQPNASEAPKSDETRPRPRADGSPQPQPPKRTNLPKAAPRRTRVSGEPQPQHGVSETMV